MADKPAETKRVRISKAQQVTLAEVLGASVILGACIVIANFLIQYIDFNSKVIGAKNKAITEYDQTIRNVGACQDTDRNGRLSDAEIAQCDPNSLSLDKVVGSLRYNIYEVMAQNANLESVARQRSINGICYNDDGTVIDYVKAYNSATTDSAREQALKGARTCSALRVISDALPAYKNTEALMASLNDIFIISKLEPENISPTDEIQTSDYENVGIIPVTFRARGSGAEILRLLENIEKSIREYDITSAAFEWTTDGIALRANARAFYLIDTFDPEAKATVRATNSKKVTKEESKLTNASSAANELLNK